MSPQQYRELEDALCHTVVCILAGGEGRRLLPLTEHRAKPAVPFGGEYRVIDFVMSNCVNSDLNKIYVFPQHLNQSLNEHLLGGWDIFLAERDQFLRIVSPQGRVSDAWYTGTAASVYENFYSIGADRPKYVIVLSSDQIYKMDYREILQAHIDSGADLTIVGLPIPRSEAHRFGVMKIDKNQRLKVFKEKPENPVAIPGRDEESLISTGIYVFKAEALVDALNKDMAIRSSKHDFGKNVVPRMLRQKRPISVYLFQDGNGLAKHWCDIGLPDAYFEANMDLVSVNPKLNLYDPEWPWRTFNRSTPPTKIVFHADIRASIVSDGCVLDDCCLERAVVSPRVRIGRNTKVRDAVIMSGVQIGNDIRIHRAIIDKENIIPDGSVVDADNMVYNGPHEITKSGIVVISRNYPAWTGE